MPGEVEDALPVWLDTVAVREVLREVTKVLVRDGHRGHFDSERLLAPGRGSCLSKKKM